MASHSEIRNACCVEYAKSNRSTCVRCKGNIRQGEVRVGQQFHADHDGYRYYHIKCFKKPPAFTIAKDFFFGYETLKPKDQAILDRSFNVKVITATAVVNAPKKCAATKRKNAIEENGEKLSEKKR